jgi:hypothetical protein
MNIEHPKGSTSRAYSIAARTTLPFLAIAMGLLEGCRARDDHSLFIPALA